MNINQHRKFRFVSAMIYTIILSLIAVGVVTCTTHKNSHTKNYGKMKNKSIKVKHK